MAVATRPPTRPSARDRASSSWELWTWFFMRISGIVLLFLGLLHGSNGLKTIIEEYARRPAMRATLKSVLYVSTFVFLLLGTLVILTFDPDQAVP